LPREFVFEIGTRLREARERRGLELAEVERDTRIRARWLRALEEERFDQLPGRVYAIGFLRTYARYVGLEEQPFVDELSSRLPPEGGREVLLAAPPARQRRPRRPWILAAVALAVIAVIAIGLIGLGGSPKRPPTVSSPAAAGRPPRATVRPPTRPRQPTPPAPHTAKPRVANLVLAATHGRCWLDARRGSPNGEALRVGTLELGQSVRLQGARIWIRLGAPRALDATLNGSRVSLPTVTPVNVVVTAGGVQEVP
jgi:cytoskeletal protein RodZ